MFGDGKRIMEVDDGTADNAVIDVKELSLSSVTVRTKSNDKLSAESSNCPVPADLLGNKNQKHKSNDDSDSDSELIEKLQNHPVMSGPPRSRELIINYGGFPDIDSDIGPSELSDIAEEPEDEYTDSENDRITTPKIKNSSSASKLDIMNMYKTPHINNNNLWRPNAKKPETNSSSQIISSHLESQKFTNPTNNNKNVVKTEQKNNKTSANLANNRNERMRIFVALFDYDPPSMSPNPDACEEELPFREGQLIKVYGEKDADGFYWGEAGSRSGFVPCNMVSEVQVNCHN